MKKKVVIIGGGFAGSPIAKKLQKKFNVTLIDSKNYFEFTPGILRTIIEPNHIKKIQVLHTNYLKYAKVITNTVKEIKNNKVILKNKKQIYFDYLVIASGSKYKSPIKEQNVLLATRAQHLIKNHKKLRHAKNVLIVGGGLAGVELATEITGKYKEKNITIIQSPKTIMIRNKKKSIQYAEKKLEENGVKIIVNEKVIIKNNKIKTNKNRNIKADIIFLTTGIKPNHESLEKNFSDRIDKEGFIKVNQYLQLENCKNIFVAGDIANIKEEKTAQNAGYQAEIVIKNIQALEKNKQLKKYKSKKGPLVISLGKYSGIYEGKIIITGLIPGILKTIIEKVYMYQLKYL